MNDMSSAVLLVGLRVAVCLRGVSMCEKERDGVCVSERDRKRGNSVRLLASCATPSVSLCL